MDTKIPEKLTGSSFARFCLERGIKLALLFGSLAKGVAREESDIDLAVMIETQPSTILERGEQKRQLMRELSSFLRMSKVDLVILNQASHLLRYQIVRTGKVLYEKEEGEFSGFVSLVLRRHTDARLFLDLDKKYLGG